MPTALRPCQPDQLLLLSRELRECLPPENRAHRVGDLIGPMESGALCSPCESREGGGNRLPMFRGGSISR